MTVTNNAVPAAPPTCCSVVRMALPCEYSRSGNTPRASVINGVNIIGGISETASEQIAEAALDKFHARQAKAREWDGPL